jgi:chemotaxis family two-component system sensor kinase Cph1
LKLWKESRFTGLQLSKTNYKHYLVALALALVTLMISVKLWDFIEKGTFMIFVLGVVLSAWYGGLGPGVVSTLAIIIGADYLLMEPKYQFITTSSNTLIFGLFVVVGGIISWTQEHRRTLTQDSHRRNQELRTLLDSLPLLVGVMDVNGVVTRTNYTSLQSASLTENDVINKPLDKTFWWSHSQEAQARVRDAIQRAQKGESIRYDAILSMSKNDYRTMDLMISPLKDEKGDVVSLISTASDITDRKRKEGELLNLTLLLQAQRRQLDSIVSGIPGIVYMSYTNPDSTQVNFTSRYAETMLGYPPHCWDEDLDFWRQVIHPEDYDRVSEDYNEVTASKGTGVLQFRCVTKDGKIIHVDSFASVLVNEKDEPIGLCGVLMDVTNRKQTEARLLRYTEDLRRSNEELEQFAYVASHDLQEPLRMVTSYLQLIAQRYSENLDTDALEFIEYAVDGASRMKQLINDLLFYSRVQRSKREFEPMRMATALEQALDNLYFTIEDTQAVITHDEMPDLTGNPAQITQLLQNLIGNALKFRRDDIPKIHISAQQQNNEWVFSVKDNGIGIHQDYKDRIFVIFQRLHNREQYEGTGIGLAICKKIVEKHNGRIWLESELGVGTTFYFTLPSNLELLEMGN